MQFSAHFSHKKYQIGTALLFLMILNLGTDSAFLMVLPNEFFVLLEGDAHDQQPFSKNTASV
ncbi:hypothetical protein AZH43_10370 [Acinetobacter pragensis]|uniref:Uncharacterized protein n=1 Tax=Acinetobacter pragensis TaxID=1806892 RepID=A0A151Y2R7_9GAMM|nr:hypothetical protein AZH43_10370 [Acinetobacter pragensis]